MSVTINEGTQTDILTTQVGGTETGIVRLDVGTGTTRSDFGGTITDVANLSKGTITAITLGTVVGNVASAATDSGNPVKVGGVYNSTYPTFTDGQRGDLQLSSRGNLRVAISNVNAEAVVGVTSDNLSDGLSLRTGAQNLAWDGSTWDRMRGDSTDGLLVNLGANNDVLVTLGTAVGANTVGGTSTTNPVQIGGTTSTGTVYTMLVDTAGNPQVDIVNQISVGTIPQVSVGTIPQVSVGTLPTLNLTTGTITTGSMANIAQIHNAGTLATGDNNIGNVDIVTGTVTQVTTVSNLTNGSVNILTGTVQNSGTTTGVGVVSNLTNGSINILTGTIQNATVLPLGLRHADEFATVVTSGTTTLGTVKAAVSGSVIYVTSLVISVGSASNVVIASGGTSTPIGGTYFFAANGGLSAQLDPPIRTTSGSALVYQQSTAGPMSITATGYVD